MEMVRATDVIQRERLREPRQNEIDSVKSLKERSLELYLRTNPLLNRLVRQHVAVSSLSEYDFDIVESTDFHEIQTRPNTQLQLFVNLARINDIASLNQYFLTVHGQLQRGGVIVGNLETLDIGKQNLFARYPKVVATVLYVFQFLYKRAMPRLPVLRRLYYRFSDGRDNVLSKAEILGRLYYCGFKVLETHKDSERFYFAACKDKPPREDSRPLGGIIIKLRRVGLAGRPIYIHKFRTMHSYSEYLQEYVYEQNNLKSNGKFEHDFRVTGWGKFMRKYWLDELPQLYDVLRGKLRLVGVRALSEHYFSLYPKKLQNLRKQFKPGLIPPYYADLPNSFDEIVESEKRYFARKLAGTGWTDCKYFLRALYNILFKSARSL